MPTNRRPLKVVNNTIITEGALTLWRRMRHITYQQADKEDEPRGRHNEFLSALRQFTALLGRDWDPGSFPPIYASSSEPPSWMTSRAQIEDYEHSHGIYHLIERLVREDDERREKAAKADDYVGVY
jgi:hypothetical protein